tara:strand:+ start:753 stop:920 length:168 start_codon:yes stop_codon:yes gene_type:complete
MGFGRRIKAKWYEIKKAMVPPLRYEIEDKLKKDLKPAAVLLLPVLLAVLVITMTV